jgi:hypothetical protein
MLIQPLDKISLRLELNPPLGQIVLESPGMRHIFKGMSHLMFGVLTLSTDQLDYKHMNPVEKAWQVTPRRIKLFQSLQIMHPARKVPSHNSN